MTPPMIAVVLEKRLTGLSAFRTRVENAEYATAAAMQAPPTANTITTRGETIMLRGLQRRRRIARTVPIAKITMTAAIQIRGGTPPDDPGGLTAAIIRRVVISILIIFRQLQRTGSRQVAAWSRERASRTHTETFCSHRDEDKPDPHVAIYPVDPVAPIRNPGVPTPN